MIVKLCGILASMKEKGQKAKDEGTGDGYQRNKEQEQWNRDPEIKSQNTVSNFLSKISLNR